MSRAAPIMAMRPLLTATAAFLSIPTSRISLPLRARAGPAQVTTWAALTKRRGRSAMKKKLSGIHLRDLPMNKRKDKCLLGADHRCRLPLLSAGDDTDL